MIAIVLAFTANSCTQNNGYIGDLFGSWVLQEMTIDSDVKEFPSDTYITISFQGDVAMFVLADDRHNTIKTYSLFTHDDDILTFNFANGFYLDSPILLLGFNSEIEITKITKLNNNNLNFTRTDNEGKIYNYKFKRTW